MLNNISIKERQKKKSVSEIRTNTSFLRLSLIETIMQLHA